MKKLFSPVVLCSIFSILFSGTACGQIPATINAAGTWSSSAGSGSVTFAAGSCYTVTVEAWGGGGGGGGASNNGASGGGGGGGFAEGVVSISGGSLCYYNVGTGGTAGTTAGTNGGPGGPTWFNGTAGTNNNTAGSFVNAGGGAGGNGATTNAGAAAQTTVSVQTFGTSGVTATVSYSGGTGGGGFVNGSGDGGGGGGGGAAGAGGNGGNGATTIVGGTGAFGCPNGGGGGGGGGGGATGAGTDGNPGNNNGGGGTGGGANGGGTGGTASATAGGLGATGVPGGPGSPPGGGGGGGNGVCGGSGGAGGDGAAGSGSIGGGGGGGTGDGGGGNGGNGGAHGGGGAGADGSSTAAGGTGGSGYLTITVALAPPPAATPGPALAAICQGSTTTIMNGSVSAGATALWTGGAGTWTNATDPVNATYTAGATETGTITLTLTATSACGTTSNTKTLTINPSPVAPTVTSPVTYCQNATATALTATGTGSLLWYTVATGGTGSSTAPTPVTTTAGQTTYYVSQTVNGCESARDSIVVIVHALPTPSFTATSPVCAGQNSTITYTGNAPANATYVWGFQGGTPPTESGQGPFSITFAVAGPALVGVSVTENGCSSDTDFSITINPLPASTFTVTTPVCTGQNSTITYTGNATGAATYTWGFSGGTVASGTGQGPYTVNWAGPGSENVTLSVTENGCSSTTTTVPVTVNPIPTSTFTVTSPVCAFQNSAITYTGNAVAGATYTWNFAGGTVASGTGQGPYNVNWPSSGSENVTLSVTQNGCTSTLTTVPVTVNPTSTATFTVTSPVCAGQNSTITYTGTGTGAATYTWGFAGGTVVSGAGQGPYNVNWPTGGSEHVTLSVTENGCSDTSSNNVLVIPIPASTFTGPASVCTGQSATFTYSGNALSTATYNWIFANGIPATASTQGPVQVSWAVAGNDSAWLTVTQNGCTSAVTTLPVTVNQSPVSNAGADTGFCSGASAVLGAATTPGNTYSWTPVTGLSSTTVSNPTVTLTNNTGSNSITNYVVTTTSANNCASTDTAVITVFPALVLGTPVIKGDSCFGGSNGCITVIASGGAPSYLYQWSTGGQGSPICSLPIGLYNLTVTDANGCVDSLDNIAVTQPDSLTISTTVSPVSCPGQSDGSILASPVGGTQPFAYTWSNTASNINPDSSLATGFYTLTVTDANGCTITTSDSVTGLPALGLTYTIQNVLCVPLTDGSISIVVASNFPPINYTWSNGANTQTLSDVGAGIYSVTVTDAHNCTADTTLTITTTSSYAITALPADTTINLGGQAPIIVSTNGVGGGVASVSWDPAYGLSCSDCTTPVASPGQSTLYHVTITSDSGCTAVDTVSITVIPVHDVYVPNVFAPAGNGVNDVLQVFGNKEAWKYFQMSIFDRWGEKVYDTHDMNFSWDGTYKGKLLPLGVYVYEMHVVYLDNFTDKDFNGSITLLR